MSKIRIEVERLQQGPYELEFEVDPVVFDLKDDPEFRFPAKIKGRLRAQLAGQDNVYVHGRLETKAETTCVRCLHPLAIDLDVPIDVVFSPHTPDNASDLEPEMEDKLLYSGDAIYPVEALREELMLALPYLPNCERLGMPFCEESDLGKGPMVFGEESSPEAEEANPNSWQAQLSRVRRQIGEGGGVG